MGPGSARARRRRRRCSSTSRCFTIGSACTRPWATEPRPRPAPAWRRSPCERRPNLLIYPLHSKGGGPTCERLIERLRRWRTRLYCADDYAVYDVLLPVGQLYTGKDETHGIERDNARQ